MLTRYQLLWAARRSMHGLRGSSPKRMDVSRKVTNLILPECMQHLDYMVDHMHGTISPADPPTMPVVQYMSDEKINRWLGFIQGALWAMGVRSIDDLRDINLTAKHRPDALRATEGCQSDGGDE